MRTGRGTSLVRVVAVAAVVVAMFAACGGPAPTSTPALAPTIEPSPTIALVTYAIDGRTACAWMIGCRAELAFEPTADPAATLDPGSSAPAGVVLDMVIDPEADGLVFDIGPSPALPTTIAPGTYRVVGAVNNLSDLASAGVVGTMGTVAACATPLTVGPATTHVSIALTFGLDGTCVVAAAAS